MAVASMKRVPPPDCPPDRPIGALIPAALPRPHPEPAPVGDLPPAPLSADSGSIGIGPAVYAIARLNRSGQISARATLAALGWTSGDPIAVTVRHRAILVRPAEHSRRTIGAGNSLVLPIAA